MGYCSSVSGRGDGGLAAFRSRSDAEARIQTEVLDPLPGVYPGRLKAGDMAFVTALFAGESGGGSPEQVKTN